MGINDLQFQKGEIRETMPAAELAALLAEMPEWQVVEDGQQMIAATFGFSDFVQALDFTNRVGELAESYNHHPEITVEYGKATVKWWTHTAGGVATNDVVLARETSKIYAAMK